MAEEREPSNWGMVQNNLHPYNDQTDNPLFFQPTAKAQQSSVHSKQEIEPVIGGVIPQGANEKVLSTSPVSREHKQISPLLVLLKFYREKKIKMQTNTFHTQSPLNDVFH